jgi:hypothetical protein
LALFLLYCRSDALLQDKRRLRIDLQDIKDYDGNLGAELERRPTDYLPLVSYLDSWPLLHS